MRTRIILSIVIVALGTTAAMLPQRSNDSIQLNERQLLQEMLRESNYLSVDELADLLINLDPSIRLIDVRDTSDFNEPIRGAINIPVDSIFSDSYAFVFDQSIMKNVIYASDDAQAVQVWAIMTQLGYKNNYLLKGGLNQWNELILNPQRPESTASKAEFDLYNQRLAAQQFFTGAEPIRPKDVFKPIAPIGGRKKRQVQGGCS